MNQVTLTGRLTADPEVRYTQTGKAVANFTLAVPNGYGEKKETSYIPCNAWEKTAETIGNTLDKGRKILVMGEWRQRSWEAKNGDKRRTDFCLVRSFEYCESRKDDSRGGTDAAKAFGGRDVFPPDEEIPF